MTMRSTLGRLDDLLRHRSVFGRHVWLRNRLRRFYHRSLNALAPGGLDLRLGGCVPVRVPAEFASKLMESHETETFACIRQWFGKHPDGMFVDIGCSLGYMSCAALFCSDQVQVLAVDADWNSLKTAQRLCRHARGDRLVILHGMISANGEQGVAWRDLCARTARHLAQHPEITGDPGTHMYVCLNSEKGVDVPRYSLDDLMGEEALNGHRRMLVKCDVEGGEVEVLSGAQRLLELGRPDLLLSVHPGRIKKLGASVDSLTQLLKNAGYLWEEFAVDHEHHWFCRWGGTG